MGILRVVPHELARPRRQSGRADLKTCECMAGKVAKDVHQSLPIVTEMVLPEVVH